MKNERNNGMIPLAEVDNFLWEMAEDYHLWDEETHGQYPGKRMLNAMSKWWAGVLVKNLSQKQQKLKK